MKLIAFEYGQTEITEQMAFCGGSNSVKIPIALLFFLIADGDRKILVDTGCDTMPGFPLFKFCSPVKVLESYGVSSDEITDIIVTHAHHDHTDGLHYYKNANVYIQKDEAVLADNYILNKDKLRTFADGIKINENIVVECIGGHSIGSSIVKIIANGKKYVLCGDECYLLGNLEHRMPTASSYNPQKSAEFVEEYSKDKYCPILFHDKDIVGEIGYKVIF